MKKDRLPPFTPTLNSLIDSNTYKKLTNSARVAYLLLCRQRKHYGQTEVCFPYSDAQEYMDRNTWSRAIKNLEQNLLISKEQVGGLYRKKNIYKILVQSIRGMEINTVELMEKVRTGRGIHTVNIDNPDSTVGKSIPTTVCKSILDHQWKWSVKDRKWKCSACGELTYSK